MISIDPVLLPPLYSQGFSGGPGFDAKAIGVDGGGEQRVSFQSFPVWHWTAERRNFKDRNGNPIDVEELVRFFLARGGSLRGFWFVDARQYSTASDGISTPTALDQVIGFGDGVKTTFKLRVQRLAAGDIPGRAHVDYVVPIHATVNAALARLVDVAESTTFNATVAVDGSPVSASWRPETREVILASAPLAGTQITWGGYFAHQARFDDQTGEGIEATISGFMQDEVGFGVQSLPSDDFVPALPGGMPFGAEYWDAQATDLARTPQNGFLQQIAPSAAINFHLWDPIDTPLGGPFMHIEYVGSTGSVTVRDHLGVSVGVLNTSARHGYLYLGVNASGDRVWVISP